MKNEKIKKLKAFDKWMRKIKNIHYGDNKVMDKAYDRVLSEMTIIFFMVSNIVFSQVHLNAGVTEVEDRLDGNTATFSVGYNHMFDRKIGSRLTGRRTSIEGLSYDSIDLQGIYRIWDDHYRADVSSGLVWNSVNGHIYPVLGFKNYFEIDPDAFITLEIENIFSSRNISHISIGIALDWKWVSKDFKPRFF